MAKGAPKNPSANPSANPAAPKAGATAAAPKTTGAVSATPAHKPLKPAAAADPVGDICLLPDIARFAH
jgi:hypothetical protein